MPLGRILCLHYVATEGAKPRRLALSHGALDAIVEKERASGRRGGTLAAASEDASRFALTFDDAHRSLLTLAAPRLRAPAASRARSSSPATMSAPATSSSRGTTSARSATPAGQSGRTRSTTHPRFLAPLRRGRRCLRAPARRRGRAARASCSRHKLGISVRDFAFPYGETTPAAREAVARAGYERAFTVS